MADNADLHRRLLVRIGRPLVLAESTESAVTASAKIARAAEFATLVFGVYEARSRADGNAEGIRSADSRMATTVEVHP